MLSVIGEFDLRIFQKPSGRDMQAMVSSLVPAKDQKESNEKD